VAIGRTTTRSNASATRGWGWDEMLLAFKAIEDNELGASDLRGAGGPLQVSTVDEPDLLLDDVIAAGTELGWRQVRDLNESDEERVGYTMATIRHGRRCGAADAFLHPGIEVLFARIGSLVEQPAGFAQPGTFLAWSSLVRSWAGAAPMTSNGVRGECRAVRGDEAVGPLG